MNVLARLRPLLHLDQPLLLGLMSLLTISLVVLYSAGGEHVEMVTRQAMRIGLGLLLMFVLAQVPPEALNRWSPAIYAAGLLLLLVVALVGVIGKGAQRWLNLGFIQFQPSEIMKLGVPMMAAWLLARSPLPPSFLLLLAAAGAVFVPVLLVAAQPDLGTAILIAVGGSLVIFLAGLRFRYILLLALAGAASVPLLWSMLHDYQKRRIYTLLDPWSDPLGAGYHTIQGIIAVGSGGWFGKGWLQGSQSQLEFIPERSTDFIFAVFAEEFGYLGALGLLAVYVFVIARALYIAYEASDTYSRLLAGSLGLTFFFYVFVNMGMVSGILPVVGVPLPLVSYGGTSMVTLLAGFGILMGIQTHRRLITR
jgi:rod shape determining protein RodA